MNGDIRECGRSSDVCPQAEESAKLAVKQVFAILGVNVDEPKEVEEFRQNLRFGATMRRATDRGVIAIVVTICTAVAAATWVGITTLLLKGR